MYKVTFIGAGYVGLVNALGFAARGAKVWVVDNNEKKIEDLKKGISPIYEKHIDSYINNESVKKNITYTTNLAYALDNTDIAFICVGTPQDEYGNADLTAVYAVAEAIARSATRDLIVVTKSTVPVGTTSMLCGIMSELTGLCTDIAVANNPEFLKEGCAFEDFNNPDRIVIGADDGDYDVQNTMVEMYKGLGFDQSKIICTNLASSEMIKYASNSMLAMRISFANLIAEYCEVTGADINDVMYCVGKDSRIGPEFLQAGIGYGGSCFPKDVRALTGALQKEGINPELIKSVDTINEIARHRTFNKLYDWFQGDMNDKTIAVWGGAFKDGTDDIREAPLIYLLQDIMKCYKCRVGFNVKFKVWDDHTGENFKKYFQDHQNEFQGIDIEFVNDVVDSITGADAVVVMTPGERHSYMDWKYLWMASGKSTIYFLDCRNFYDIYDSISITKAGFHYEGIARNWR